MPETLASAAAIVRTNAAGFTYALTGKEPSASAMKSAGELIVPGLVFAEVDYHLRRQRGAMHRLWWRANRPFAPNQ